jgi:hypothetical protein
VFAEANMRIRHFAGRAPAATGDDVAEFLCECGQPECRATVRLPLSVFDKLKLSGEPVVANDH